MINLFIFMVFLVATGVFITSQWYVDMNDDRSLFISLASMLISITSLLLLIVSLIHGRQKEG